MLKPSPTNGDAGRSDDGAAGFVDDTTGPEYRPRGRPDDGRHRQG